MKVFNRKQSNFDLGTSMGTGPKLIFFFKCKKSSIEWCSHKTFDKKKYLCCIVAKI